MNNKPTGYPKNWVAKFQLNEKENIILGVTAPSKKQAVVWLNEHCLAEYGKELPLLKIWKM